MTDPVRIPVLDPEATNLELALALAADGCYVLPTSSTGDAKHAGSVLGKGWPAKSSRDVEQVAAWYAGTDHRVAIHCGRSGLVAFDVDHPDMIPAELKRAVVELAPPFQSTRPDEPERGHYLFQQPPGRRIGNRPGRLGRDWGEVRGTNGIILVGGVGREWLQTGEVPELPDYLAELLPDVDDGEAAVSDSEVERFVELHTLGVAPRRLDNVLKGFEQAIEGGGSRHVAMVGAACWAVREIVAGRVGAEAALWRLGEAFIVSMSIARRATDRTLNRDQARAEFRSGIAWAIGQEWVPSASVEGDEPKLDLAAQVSAAWFEAEVRGTQDHLEVRAEAQRRFDEARRPPRSPIAERTVSFSDLATIPPPRMLIDRLMPDQAVGFLNGRSGSFKSFLLVALAVSIGSRTPVMNEQDFRVARRGRVLYVAAEGSAGVALRMRAYASAHKVEDADVILLPGDLNLSSDRDVTELYGYAASQGCSHVFVDTFRAAAVGVKEIDSTEVGRVIAGAIRARDEHGVGTLYADHTGHAGERAVGAESKWANVDYALMVRMPNGSRRPDQQRTLSVEKLKDLETSGEWPLRLRPVPEVRDADGNPSAVVEIGEVSGSGPFGMGDHPWWSDEVPPEIVGLFNGQPGRHAALDIVRILRHIDDEDGLTKAELATVSKDSGKVHSGSSWRAGVALVKKVGVAVDGRTPEKYVIAPQWICDRSDR